MKKRIYQWHRRLAWLMAVPLLLWALSGVLHPMMSNWFKPTIENRFLPPQPLELGDCNVSVDSLGSGLGELHMTKVIVLQQRPVLLAITPEQEHHYVDLTSGESLHDGEHRYVEQLARAYMGDQTSPLVKISKITEFDAGYSYINRFLPVYRVELDREDGLQVVVDPRSGRLATYDNRFRRVATKLFSWCHTWSFLGSRDSILRITVVSLMSGAAFLLALSGLLSLFIFRGKRKMPKKRRFHRLGGMVTAVFFFMFSLSAFFHVVVKFDYDRSDSWASQQKVSSGRMGASFSELAAAAKQPIKEVTLAVVGEEPYYRVSLMGKKGSVLYLHTDSLQLLAKGEQQYAEELALEFSGYPAESIAGVEKITSFRDDYGFIFRRLPVWRVKFEGQSYWQYTVDTRDAHMSMRTNASTLVEALSFVYLHKFHFLDPLGKSFRDWFLVVLMGLIVTMTISGMCLLKRRNKRVA